MSRPERGQEGLNLHIYPSTLEGASRLRKISSSVQRESAFSETHVVGMRRGDLPTEEQVAPDVRFIRLAGTKRTGNLGRILKTLLWQPRVFLTYRRQNVAVVAAHSVWVLPMCAALASSTGAALVYNPHELETETVAMRGLKRWVAQRIERRLVRKASVVTTVNGSIAQWYADAYDIPTPIAVTNIPEDDGSTTDLRADLGIPEDALLFVHTGNLAPGRNIPLLLEAFPDRPDRHLVFVGDGPLKGLVTEAAARQRNIHQVPPVGPFSVVGAMRSADVGVSLMEGDSLSQQYCSPNKFYESLCAGVPPLATKLVELRRVLGPHADRWTVAPEIDALRAWIDEITREDIAQFRATPPAVGSWDDQVAPMVRRYQELALERGNARARQRVSN